MQGSVSREATILVVDDERGVARTVLEEYLATHGYTAIGAESAASARAIAAKQQVEPRAGGYPHARGGRPVLARICASATRDRDRHADLGRRGRGSRRRPRDGRGRLREQAFDPRELLAP